MVSNNDETKKLIITANQAQECVESILRNICRLRESIWDSGMSDRWLDRQFVITKGNLRDLSRMFGCCAANYLQLLKSDYPQLNKEKSVGLFKI